MRAFTYQYPVFFSAITALSTAIAATLIPVTEAKAVQCLFFLGNTVAEIQDAGQSLETAQRVVSETSPVECIAGSLNDANDVDLFKIFLTGTTPFSVRFLSPSPSYSLLFDFQLFLFDEQGFGVLARDDTPLTPGATFPNKTLDNVSALPSFPPTLLPAGKYFLGVSWFNNNPVSAGGQIFPDQPYQAVLGPTGSGGHLPLTGWTNTDTPGRGGPYFMRLTGVDAIAQATSVPEPSLPLGGLLIAVSGSYCISKRRRKLAA